MAERKGETPESPENPKLVKLTVECESMKCAFCKKHEHNELEWGVMYMLDDIVVHYFCLLFCAALNQKGQDHEGILGFLPADIKKELRRGQGLKCKFCKINGATLGCALAKCKASFHFTCGVQQGTLHQFTGSFDSYCSVHKPKVNIPIPEGSAEVWECGICYCEVEPTTYPVWSPCCRTRVFHRLCIQRYANSSGLYFFSCPFCKDTKKFLEAMQRSGVYVPERDAQWELEPNAYEELTEVYSQCDAKDCLSKHGRKYVKDTSERWRLNRCEFCGSGAIHAICVGLRSNWNCDSESYWNWKCPSCSQIAFQAGSNLESTVRRQRDSHGSSVASGSDDDGLNGNTNDDDYRIRVAANASLVGIEREANLCHHPREYIRKQSLTSESKPLNIDMQAFQEAFKRKIDAMCKGLKNNDNLKRKGLESRSICTQYEEKNSHEEYKSKLSGLKKSDNASKACVDVPNPEANRLKSLSSISNLDLSEHRSKSAVKQLSLPEFLDPSRYQGLTSYKIPKKKNSDGENVSTNGPNSKNKETVHSKEVQMRVKASEPKSQSSNAGLLRKSASVPHTCSSSQLGSSNSSNTNTHTVPHQQSPARLKTDASASKGVKLSSLGRKNPAELLPDIRRFLISKNFIPPSTSISCDSPESGSRVPEVNIEKKMDSTKKVSDRKQKESTQSMSYTIICDDESDDDLEVVEVVINSESKRTSFEDLTIRASSSEQSDDDIVILSDAEEESKHRSTSRHSSRKLHSADSGIPIKSEPDFSPVDTFYIQPKTVFVPHDVRYNRRNNSRK